MFVAQVIADLILGIIRLHKIFLTSHLYQPKRHIWTRLLLQVEFSLIITKGYELLSYIRLLGKVNYQANLFISRAIMDNSLPSVTYHPRDFF